MKNVALHNLGCKVNSYEMDFIQQNLLKKGFNIVPFDQFADIYIVNTCTVTNIADRKSRQMLHRCKQLNKEAIVVAVGCYVQTDTENVLKDENIDIAIGNNNKSKTVDAIIEYIEAKEKGKIIRCDRITDVNDVKNPCPFEKMNIAKTAEHTRAFIKIQDGCNQFCSYCIIPFARGRVRSRKKEDIIAEIQTLVSAGYNEIVLTGIHIDSYGIDFKDGSDFISLLEEVDKIEGLERIRIGSLEPRVITKDFANRIINLRNLCPHFHLSLQSGCDSVLKRMNRHYTTADYLESVELLRQTFDRPAITTDVITGFPGETEEEFHETEEFLKRIGFYEVHLFPYSRRHGTVADKMPNQLTKKVKSERVEALSIIEREKTIQYRKSFIGEEEKVLFEEPKIINGERFMVGYTSRYVSVAVKTEENLSNKLLSVKLLRCLTDTILEGELI